jgi:FG-GAP-like repeat
LRALARAFSALVLGVVACSRLPEVEANECGNGVIEPPEDCDTFADDAGAGCRPPGSVGACHLDCSPGGAGLGGCPAGWGCDLGGICRRPTGRFIEPREFEVGTANALASADFDGDGRADVLSTEPPDAFGVTRIKFHYFDEQGALDETRSFPHLLLSPVIANMQNDGRADVLFTDSRVGMLLGRADRSWVPETFSSYRVPGTSIRTLTLRDALVDHVSGFVVLADFDAGPGVYVPQGYPRLIGALPKPIDELVGAPVGGQVIEGAPCKQALLALRGEAQFSMLDACVLSPDGSVVWRPEVLTKVVALEPPEPIVFPPQVVDMNGDGHLDVIVGSAERTFVAYGDGLTLATAVPFALRPTDVSAGDAGAGDAGVAADAGVTSLPMPLAAGDVTGDGVVDFVLPQGLLLSAPSSVPGRNEYSPIFGGRPSWTAAAIADLNANGHPDIIVGSSERPGLNFYNGTGTSDLTLFAVPTSRPVQRITLGDYDGDLIEDVAFTQDGGGDGSETQVMISFGVPFGAPLPGVPVARLSNVEQMATFREAMLSHLLIASSEGSGTARRGVLTLLTGSGDRIPVALYELTTFSADSSVNGSSAARVLGGAFTSSAPGDALALAVSSDLPDAKLEFWLLPALGTSIGSPVLLSGGLPEGAHPIFPDGQGFSLATAVGDVDGDGRDEAILAMPALDDEHCALLLFGVDPSRVTERGELIVPEPCAHIELAPVQADGDGRLDLACLTGRADGTDRRLSIFWNDGAGAFSLDRRSIISDRAASPQAFALLPANAARGTSVAYATPLGLEQVGIDGATRALGEPVPLFPLAGCTGMTAADLNGDGAVDLVAAARGNLHVLEAGLESL